MDDLITAMQFTGSSTPILVSIASFAAYVLSSPEHVLTPERAFVSLTLFNILRSPMYMIAGLIAQLVQVLVSNKRMKEVVA